MEPEGQLPCSQGPPVDYPKPDESNLHPYILHTYIHINILILSSHLNPHLLTDFFPSSFSTKILHVSVISLMHTTCYNHPIHLDVITLIIFRVQIMKFFLCNFVQSPVTSSLLGPNILLSTLS